MKKYTKVLALALALTMMLSMSVFAAEYEVKNEAGNTSAVIDTENSNKFDLTTDSEAGEMYLLLILNGTDTVPDKDNILYVNQETASGTRVTFSDVYPKSIADSTIYLAGGNLGGLTKIALLDAEDPEYVIGDADGNTIVEMNDAIVVLRHDLEIEEITDSTALKAAEVTGDTTVDMGDAIKILQYVLEIITSWN